MNKKKKYAGFLCLLLFLLILSGCGRDEGDSGKTDSEEQNTKAKLKKVESALEKIKIERDGLVSKLSAVSGKLRKTNIELASVSGENDRLLRDIEKFDDQLNSSIARLNTSEQQVAKLKDQLKEEVKNNGEYQVLVSELELTIKGLEQQVKDLAELPAEQPDAEMIEDNTIEDETNEDMEVLDGNNV